MFKSPIMEVDLDEGGKHDKATDNRKLETQYKKQYCWAKQSLEAVTEMFSKKNVLINNDQCSYYTMNKIFVIIF